MLILEADIYFDKLCENPNALPHDLSTNNILRPALNFGNCMLFSGTILADKSVEIIRRGKHYRVVIEMPTIEHEAYELIKELLYIGNSFFVQTASKVIGRGRILDFDYS